MHRRTSSAGLESGADSGTPVANWRRVDDRVSSGAASVSHLTLSVGLTLLSAMLPASAAGETHRSEATHARPASERMWQRVDELIQQRLDEAGVAAAPISDDAEFLRRVHLDLTGVIPHAAEVREFLADADPDKRAKVIDRLLASPRCATHLANTWRQFMLPGTPGPEQLANVAGLQNWLRTQFASNMRYDRIVADLLVANGGGDAGPALYFTSLELAPEKLAASTSRIFLGLQIECAQCHRHPYDDWSQKDFWGYAAFFARLGRNDAMGDPRSIGLVDLNEGEVRLPETEAVVAPQHLDGTDVDDEFGGNRREKLAIWMASRDNPFLARAAVNRVWSHLFGRGIVDPVDDLGPLNPPSHPQLLDELTEYFIGTGFDLSDLLRTLANTSAYQRTSRVAGEQSPAPELFAAMAVKTLSADQLYDCLQRVMRSPASATPAFLPGAGAMFDPRRLAFAAKMRMQGTSATEFDAGVLQALTLLNGSVTSAVTSVEQSGLLAALEAPWLSDEQRIEALFLATVSRLPREHEREPMAAYLAAAGSSEDARAARADVLWALINTAEFVLNH